MDQHTPSDDGSQVNRAPWVPPKLISLRATLDTAFGGASNTDGEGGSGFG